jgi:crotonobetainyl-CoA:carnitine CoA-transferase CaiB-like acyl-CoA transferase
VTDSLHGLRVLELGREVAAPYCSKLLADLGADVVKVEPARGDSLRGFGPFPSDRDGPNASGLFCYLNANKRGISINLETSAGAATLRQLARGADLVIEDLGAGELERLGLGLDVLAEGNAALALVRISNFGQTGPHKDVEATDLVLQAAGGWVGLYDAIDAEPVRVGGRVSAYLVGVFAAASALTAVQAARQRSKPVSVDVSAMECLVGTLPYPMMLHQALLALGVTPSANPPRTPFGVLRCKDGWIGLNILTDPHWGAACELVGVPEFSTRRGDVTRNAETFEEFRAAIRPFLEAHSAEELLARAQAARIPAALVGSGRSLLDCAQVRARPFFVDQPGHKFQRPGFPYRLSGTPARLRTPAPRLGEPSATWSERDSVPLGVEALAGTRADSGGLPFAGLRVLDLGTFWAGPYAGMYLASQGADVLKIESIQRPDGFRFVGLMDHKSPQFYEAGALFQATNLGKRNLTLNLNHEQGRALLRRLIAGADVLIENFAPRVMERFGFDYEHVRELRPDILMVRMPAYGLDGPWRDHVGWALAIAQAAGISWVTGDPDDTAPRNPGAFLDCAVGMHALVAIQAALAERRRSGLGQLIEVPQFETATCMCAEQVIDYSLNGRIQERHGNRSRTLAPEGVYATRDARHVALSVRDDAEWQRLIAALGSPEWALDTALSSTAERLRRHDELDRGIRNWTSVRDAAEIVAALRDRGVPAAAILVNSEMYAEPQLVARDYYQTLDHPISGERRYPVWPMRFSFAKAPVYASGAATLGQHNEEILGGDLRLSDDEIARLRSDEVIGERWKI